MSQFRLPDLGEGLEEAQLVQWLVQVGDAVSLNQPICQVETAKALVDIPSPFAGTITALHANPGDTVLVGAPLLTVAEAGEQSAGTMAAGGSGGESDGHGPVLVGYGTEGPAQTYTRRRRGNVPAVVAAASSTATVGAVSMSPGPATTQAAGDAGKASPLVRKMAQERGVDLSAIVGTGPGGRIRVEDLETAAMRGTDVQGERTEVPIGGVSAIGGVAGRSPAAPHAELAADEERISTVGLRKAIAARMLKAATTIPHFTEYSLFDASALVALRDRLRGERAYAEVKLTFLPLFVRALVEAVKAYPILNSRWDEEGNAIIVKHSIHVGIATDTPRGLLVPVIRDAHAMSLAEIAVEGNRLVHLAREGKLDAKSLSGSTITITNVGAAGPVDTGAPLINPPEVCVVGFGAIKLRALVVEGQVLARPSAWLSMSGDHRVVDGATAAQFMGVLVGNLEHPDALA